ncbi:MAG: GNAT family N-acetyltransferase [Planctomycetaceae bacterium]|nr:GNAT family N-acetyltransferase [Planctomycetaceae bacterium]
MSLDISGEVSESDGSSVCWKMATEKDVDKMILLGCYDVGEEFIKSFVRSDNEYLLLGLKDNVIQTYAVCAVRQKRMNGLFFRLTDEETFISICFTRSDCRGQGWGPKCIREICRRCREANLKRVFIDISTSNTSSIRSAEKAGAKQTNSWYYRIRIWKRDHLFPFGQYRNRFFKK